MSEENYPQTLVDENGEIPVMDLANAVQVWSIMQKRPLIEQPSPGNGGYGIHAPVTVAEAATAFCCEPKKIIEAVEDHPWMFLDGGRDDDPATLGIEHEGD